MLSIPSLVRSKFGTFVALKPITILSDPCPNLEVHQFLQAKQTSPASGEDIHHWDKAGTMNDPDIIAQFHNFCVGFCR